MTSLEHGRLGWGRWKFTYRTIYAASAQIQRHFRPRLFIGLGIPTKLGALLCTVGEITSVCRDKLQGLRGKTGDDDLG